MKKSMKKSKKKLHKKVSCKMKKTKKIDENFNKKMI